MSNVYLIVVFFSVFCLNIGCLCVFFAKIMFISDLNINGVRAFVGLMANVAGDIVDVVGGW